MQIPLHILYFISGFFSRNPDIWLFGCWNGKKFRGNSKALYLYVKKNFPDICSCWITKDIALYRKLRKDKINVYYAFSLKGFIVTLRAKFFFVTHGINDINQFVARRGVLINMDHAIYPIKDMSLLPKMSLLKKIYSYLQKPYGYLVKPDYAITSSVFTSAATKHHYNLSDSRVIITGTPKSDLLFMPNCTGSNLSHDSDCLQFLVTDKKCIFFLPTWRSNLEFSIFDYGFDLKELDYLLKEINGIMAFNFHPTTVKYQKIPNFNNYDNIKSFNYNGDETNRLLRNTDLLITDYSALFADFLIYDKPMIFC